jgi:hypothetical protein
MRLLCCNPRLATANVLLTLRKLNDSLRLWRLQKVLTFVTTSFIAM